MSNMNVLMHNMQSMFSKTQLGIVTNRKAKATEKLSSGFKINRAADDAAGLTISENMRSQIRGLHQGAKNIQEGISFCQVADGAMAEVNDMLQRVVELSIKSANGTNTDQDRQAIDREVQEILREINRIGDSTEFNERKVFPAGSGTNEFYSLDNPTAKTKFFQLFGDGISKTGFMSEPLDFGLIQQLNSEGKGTGNNNHGDHDYVGVHIDFNSLFNNNSFQNLDGTAFYVNCCTDCCPNKVEFSEQKTGVSRDGDVVTIGLKDQNGQYYSSADSFLKDIVGKYGNQLKDSHVEFAYNDSTLYIYDIDNNEWSDHNKELAYFCDVPDDFTNPYVPTSEYAEKLWIHMGPKMDDGMEIPLHELSANSLGLDGGNCLTAESSKQMIGMAKRANDILNDKRSMFGAFTNRLEHAYNTNLNTAENTQAAESGIRDTDMADEMVRFTKDNILEQAGQTILAQANQNRQGILNLLQ